MEKLKNRILEEGLALGSDRINVSGFVNHQIDTELMDEIGREIAEKFSDVKVDKILTVEASGIAVAIAAAKYFGFCPVVFAKKAKPNTMEEDVYCANAMSFTKQKSNDLIVSGKYLSEGENVLIIDDFLAFGEASKALLSIAKDAGANVVGFGIVISKDFQGGKKALEDMGYRVVTMASVSAMEDGKITFAD